MMIYQPGAEKLCLKDTLYSASSLSTARFIPQPIPSKSHYVPNRLFIGGFPENTTSRELCTVFAQFGRILGCNIMHKEQNRHYGFITFDSLAAAERVHDLYKRGIRFTIHGKTLKIRSAMFQPKKKDSSDGNNFNYLEGNRVIPTYHQGTTYYKDLPAEYKISPLHNIRPEVNYNQYVASLLHPEYANPTCLTLPVNLIQNSIQLNACYQTQNRNMQIQSVDPNHQMNRSIISYI